MYFSNPDMLWANEFPVPRLGRALSPRAWLRCTKRCGLLGAVHGLRMLQCVLLPNVL